MGDLFNLEATWDVWRRGPLQSHRKLLGLPVRIAKRAMLALMDPFNRELLRRQRDFNRATLDELKDLVARLERLESERGQARFPITASHRYNGVPLTLFLPDPVSASWYDSDWPSVPEVDFLKQSRMTPGSTVFDIGAHQGVFALMFADAVGPKGKVVAVEANKDNVAAAEKNRELNHAAQLTIVHAAGSNAPGKLSFGRGTNGQVDAEQAFSDSVEVRAVTVDELAHEHGTPDVLFIDVEGFECKVLEGAKETLRKSKPDLFIEVHRNCGLEAFGGSVDALVKQIPAGYELFCSQENQRELRPFKGAGDPVAGDRFFLAAVNRPRA